MVAAFTLVPYFFVYSMSAEQKVQIVYIFIIRL